MKLIILMAFYLLERVKDPKTFAHYDELKKQMEIQEK